jgi:hypothetical protein
LGGWNRDAPLPESRRLARQVKQFGRYKRPIQPSNFFTCRASRQGPHGNERSHD